MAAPSLLTARPHSSLQGPLNHLRLQKPLASFGGWGVGQGQHKCKQCRGCTTARDYYIMESRGWDSRMMCHVLLTCSMHAPPQLQPRRRRSYK